MPSHDKILFHQIKKDNTNAFTTLFNLYWEKLFTFAYNILKDETLAKDIVQEVYISIWDRRKHLEITNLKSYLFKSIKYQTAKSLRNHPQFETYNEIFNTISAINESPENELAEKELKLLIDSITSKLPEKCAEVFHLSRKEGLSNQEVAERLNISTSTVENQINKALKILRKELHEYSYIIILLPLLFT